MNILTKIMIGAGLVSSMISSAKESEKKVFAHYMTCFTSSPEFYKREIMLAQHYDIDGFALNCGEWLKPQKDGKTIATRYVQNADNIFEQAKQLGTGFKLFMSPDYAGKLIRGEAMLNVTDMFTRYYKHPNLFHYRGKAFYSGWSGYVSEYKPPVEKMRKDGYEFWLVPKTSKEKYKMAYSMETVLNLYNNDSPLDGNFYFACDGTVKEIITNNAVCRRATLFNDKIYMAGVCPAYNSPNLRDFHGVQGYCAQWQGLINDSADLVEIVTWNDYNEDSNLTPYRWRSGFGKVLEKQYFNRDESYLDVTSYYINYFKTGVEPDITQDRIYFTYRSRSKNQTRVWNDKTKQWVDIRFDKWPYEQMHDDVNDKIYVTGFLTDDAVLTVKTGGKKKKIKLAKGISSCELPFAPGTPQFILKRDRKELINVYGRKEIVDKTTKANSTKGYRLANRTWTSGAVAGEVTMSLNGNDTKVEKDKSLTLSTKELPAGTYNFRITYKNDSDEEARLTLYCDGAPGANAMQRFYFPLFLPSTHGKFRTVSFIWTMLEKPTKFEIMHEYSTDERVVGMGHNDIGSAVIRSINLIKVEPFVAKKAPKQPEMISIPAGEFTMGSDDGNPDEAPKYKVKVSAFTIAKYEVTNKEYEKFRPEHKKHRDGYSWRDREPVIYVSWKDAASYCNWLSAQHNLTPVYDENSWDVNMDADGFRLPTEAEWEYVASGRGENRPYPWGKDKPTAEYGNFQLEKALEINPLTTSSISKGVTIVGSFPAGASRDGVMDMAGNVAEWCSDRYNLYKGEKQENPLGVDKSPHRTMRGGSWGYYNGSQRCVDREFNNDGYPGYVYIGFRIAISEAGYNKIK